MLKKLLLVSIVVVFCGRSGAAPDPESGAVRAGAPFPSDVFTRPAPDNRTGLAVSLPKPDCATRPSECEDIDMLNTLDGFSLQPRISIPFDGPIDIASVTSDSIIL